MLTGKTPTQNVNVVRQPSVGNYFLMTMRFLFISHDRVHCPLSFFSNFDSIIIIKSSFEDKYDQQSHMTIILYLQHHEPKNIL